VGGSGGRLMMGGAHEQEEELDVQLAGLPRHDLELM
jgi:hypothetical protein